MLKIVPNSPKVLLISISEQDFGTWPSHKVVLQTEKKKLKHELRIIVYNFKILGILYKTKNYIFCQIMENFHIV